MSTDKEQEDDEYKPRWAYRAEHIEYKPDWVDAIPHELWELGQVFFPIPNSKKAWEYPHHLDEYRYEADNEILNAYLESNSNYGIACAGNLAVVDIDEVNYIDYFKDKLPDTLWQITGSRTGEHLFYMCEGLNTRITLRVPKPERHMTAEGIERIENSRFQHFGEVKCDPHGYVVGPGSKHPSGNKYGPLQGEEIDYIDESDLRDVLTQFINDQQAEMKHVKIEREKSKTDTTSQYAFYNLEPDDVIPWLEPGNRVPHPVHGSSTGTNFMRRQEEDVFMCWRHDYGNGPGCALNPQQLLAVMATGRECDIVRQKWKSSPVLHYKAWREAVDKGLVSYKRIPYTVARGYAVKEGFINADEELERNMYWDTINAIRITVEDSWMDLEADGGKNS